MFTGVITVRNLYPFNTKCYDFVHGFLGYYFVTVMLKNDYVYVKALNPSVGSVDAQQIY